MNTKRSCSTLITVFRTDVGLFSHAKEQAEKKVQKKCANKKRDTNVGINQHAANKSNNLTGSTFLQQTQRSEKTKQTARREIERETDRERLAKSENNKTFAGSMQKRKKNEPRTLHVGGIRN